MRLSGDVHLTYCSNIHPGESWAEVEAALREHVPQIRKQLAHEGPFGLGLRLSARAARTLRDPEAQAAFRRWLAAEDAYVFTLNGFPYGPFHGTPVKEAVYRPDWSTPERVDYTHDLIEVLAALLPRDLRGSISTVPGAFRRDPASNAPETVAEGLLRAAVACWTVAQREGLELSIGVEPEPMCMLETTDEAVTFFEEHLFRRAAIERFATLAKCSASDAECAIRRHLGLCFDTCHAAVEFEDPAQSARRIEAAGVRIAKIQVTAGLELPDPTPEGLERLSAFAEGVYLHQVVVRAADGLIRILDLPEALERARGGVLPSGPWRVHLHVPVCDPLEPPLRSTAPFVRDILPRIGARCDHFEVETYTWSVLPSSVRARPLATSIADELRWTRATWRSR